MILKAAKPRGENPAELCLVIHHRARSSPSPAVPWFGFYLRIIVLEIS